jgi:hypothetical protein
MKLADPDNDAGWFGRFTHYDFLILAVGEAGVVASYALGTVWQTPGKFGVVGFLLLVFVGIRAQRRHMRHPCEKCIGDMPLDAQAQAARKKLSLRVYHWLTSPVWFTLAIAVCTSTFWLASWVRSSILAALSVGVVLSSVAGWRHRPLQLVCPWCRDDDGDDDGEVPERTPVPDPVGVKTA